MTKRQREQVVELLRCAADIGMRGRVAPLTEASYRLFGDTTKRETIVGIADDVIEQSVSWKLGADESETWRMFAADCLEAAARIEEGS